MEGIQAMINKTKPNTGDGAALIIQIIVLIGGYLVSWWESRTRKGG